MLTLYSRLLPKTTEIVPPFFGGNRFWRENFWDDSLVEAKSSGSFGKSIGRKHIEKTNDGLLLVLDIPGVSENDFTVEALADGKLRIKAKRSWNRSKHTDIHEQQANERNSDDKQPQTQREQDDELYSEVFTLSEKIDANSIKAEHAHGVLQIHLPYKAKSADEVARLIEVQPPS